MILLVIDCFPSSISIERVSVCVQMNRRRWRCIDRSVQFTHYSYNTHTPSPLHPPLIIHTSLYSITTLFLSPSYTYASFLSYLFVFLSSSSSSSFFSLLLFLVILLALLHSSSSPSPLLLLLPSPPYTSSPLRIISSIFIFHSLPP